MVFVEFYIFEDATKYDIVLLPQDQTFSLNLALLNKCLDKNIQLGEKMNGCLNRNKVYGLE